jgi:hypothetical protein
MKIERKGPSSGRQDYQWRVDTERGFKSAKFFYDRDGKLIAVDYELPKMPVREVPKASDQ